MSKKQHTKIFLNNIIFWIIFCAVSTSWSAGEFTDVSHSMMGLNFGSALNWGDYDNDGDLDIVVAGYHYTSGSDYTKLYRNNNGVFSAISTPFTGVDSASIIWGDYNNDGWLDLFLTGFDGNELGDVSALYQNTNSSSFSKQNIVFKQLANSTAAWADFNRDGFLDVAIAGYNGTDDADYTLLYANNGNGTFTEMQAGFVGIEGGELAWADYNNDGYPDLAVIGSNWNDIDQTVLRMKLYRNNGNGTFTDTGMLFTDFEDDMPIDNFYGSLAWGDFNGDGYIDLAISGLYYADMEVYAFTKIFINNNGTSFTPSSIVLEDISGDIAWADFDNNGTNDLLVSGWDSVSAVNFVMVNNGNGTVNFINLGLNDYAGPCAWGDYDKDGKLDIAILAEPPYYNSDGVMKLYRNTMGVPANTLPAPPTTLNAEVTGNAVNFSWNNGSDAATPANQFTYNIRVGTTPGGNEVYSSMSNSISGYRLIPAPGNMGRVKNLTLNLPDGRYYWSVQTVDGAYAGSAWATEQLLLIGAAQGLTVNISLAAGQTVPSNATKLIFDVVFSEPVADFTKTDVTLTTTTGASSISVSGKGTTYQISISGMKNPGVVAVSLQAGVAHTSLGAPNSTSEVVMVDWDRTAPQVVVQRTPDQLVVSETHPLYFHAIFSEPVFGFTVDDITVSTNSKTPLTVELEETETPNQYLITVSGFLLPGTATVSIKSNKVTDVAGNFNKSSIGKNNKAQYKPNVPPVAAKDSYSAKKNIVLNIAAPGVLKNDKDADKDVITVAEWTEPTSGVLVMQANGAFSYTPAPGFTGKATFSYVAVDSRGNRSAETLVTITVK